MKIDIEALSFEAIIGILEEERLSPQKVEIDISLLYRYADGKFIDYAEVCRLTKEHIVRESYGLLEDALIGIERLLKTKFPNIDRLRISIRKPDILSECTVSLSQEWIY